MQAARRRKPVAVTPLPPLLMAPSPPPTPRCSKPHYHQYNHCHNHHHHRHHQQLICSQQQQHQSLKRASQQSSLFEPSTVAVEVFNIYGLIRPIPSNHCRPSLPPCFRLRKFLIDPPQPGRLRNNSNYYSHNLRQQHHRDPYNISQQHYNSNVRCYNQYTPSDPNRFVDLFAFEIEKNLH